MAEKGDAYRNSIFLHVILNELKDQYPRVAVYVYVSSLRLILHPVQDDMYTIRVIPGPCISPDAVVSYLAEGFYEIYDIAHTDSIV